MEYIKKQETNKNLNFQSKPNWESKKHDKIWYNGARIAAKPECDVLKNSVFSKIYLIKKNQQLKIHKKIIIYYINFHIIPYIKSKKTVYTGNNNDKKLEKNANKII